MNNPTNITLVKTLSTEFLQKFVDTNAPEEKMFVDFAVEAYFNNLEKDPSKPEVLDEWDGLGFSPQEAVDLILVPLCKIVIPLFSDLYEKKISIKKNGQQEWYEVLQYKLEKATRNQLGPKTSKKLSKAFIVFVKEHPEFLFP